MTPDERAKHAASFRRSLEDGDYMHLWTIWSNVMPHLPQPKTPSQAEMIMHLARTEAESIPFEKRAYSHSWLLERNHPSGLPDHLRPRAERMYPRVVEGVGIAVKMPTVFKDVSAAVQKSMSEAVEELHADGVDLKDRKIVHEKMFNAREKTLAEMFGRGKRPLGRLR